MVGHSSAASRSLSEAAVGSLADSLEGLVGFVVMDAAYLSSTFSDDGFLVGLPLYKRRIIMEDFANTYPTPMTHLNTGQTLPGWLAL